MALKLPPSLLIYLLSACSLSSPSSASYLADLISTGIGLGSKASASTASAVMLGSPSMTDTFMNMTSAISHSNVSATLTQPSTTNATVTISGCFPSLLSYAAANSSWNAVPGHTSLVDTTSIHSDSQWASSPPHETPYTTLCDGFPRASMPWSFSFRTDTYTYSITENSVVTPFPRSPPSCTLDDDDCHDWWTTHFSCSATSWYSAYKASDVPASCTPYLISEPCPQPSNFLVSDRPSVCMTGDSKCVLYGDQMQLLYWPVTRTSYDVCNRTGGTITENPATAVVYGKTISSPHVALRFTSLYAYDACGHIGTDMTDVIITVPPTDISSGGNHGLHILDTSWPLDYGDLWPNHVSSRAWFNQPDCFSLSVFNSASFNGTGAAWISSFGQAYPGCGTIWEANFQPRLIAPTQIYALQSLWSTCRADFGLYDPPQALTQAPSADSVTTPGVLRLTSVVAAPSSSPTGVAQQTAAPYVASLYVPTAGPSENSWTGQPVVQSDLEPPARTQSQKSSLLDQSPSQQSPSQQSPPQQSSITVQDINGSATGANSGSTVIIGSSGQNITVEQQGSSVVAAVGESTITVAAGLKATISDCAIAVPSSGGDVIIDSKTVFLSVAGSDVDPLQVGSSVVLVDGSRTFTLADGMHTTIDGLTLSNPGPTPDPVLDNGNSVDLHTTSSYFPDISSGATKSAFTGTQPAQQAIEQGTAATTRALPLLQRGAIILVAVVGIPELFWFW